MIEVSINEDMLKRAKARSLAMGAIRNSITRGEGNIAGFLGEEIIQSYLGGKIVDHKDYDIIYGNRLIDVKTKRCTSRPKGFYECSVAATSTHQECTEYIFVRIEWHKSRPNRWKRGWILGRISRDEYFYRSKKLKKGQVDRRNNYVVKADCHNLAISELGDLL